MEKSGRLLQMGNISGKAHRSLRRLSTWLILRGRQYVTCQLISPGKRRYTALLSTLLPGGGEERRALRTYAIHQCNEPVNSRVAVFVSRLLITERIVGDTWAILPLSPVMTSCFRPIP